MVSTFYSDWISQIKILEFDSKNLKILVTTINTGIFIVENNFAVKLFETNWHYPNCSNFLLFDGFVFMKKNVNDLFCFSFYEKKIEKEYETKSQIMNLVEISKEKMLVQCKKNFYTISSSNLSLLELNVSYKTEKNLENEFTIFEILSTCIYNNSKVLTIESTKIENSTIYYIKSYKLEQIEMIEISLLKFENKYFNFKKG